MTRQLACASVLLGIFAITLHPSQVARASLATSVAEFASPQVVDFSQFNNPSYNAYPATSPLQVGQLVGEDILFSGTGSEPQAYNGVFGLGISEWNSGRAGYVLMGDFRSRSITFTFADPVAAAGGIVSQPNGALITLLALDALGNVIESADTFVAPSSDDNVGTFRGILRDTADIYGFQINASNLILDDLMFSRSTGDPGIVPEATSFLTWGLLGLTGAVIASSRRKRRG
jgi:hypothetical protein